MLESYLSDLGVALFLAGVISLIRPLRFVYIRTRRWALMVSGVGLLLAVGILLQPYRDQEAANRATKLDDWMPRWQVDERHVLKIAAPPAKVFAAIHEVRADEIL